MSLEVFHKAINLIEDLGTNITIGGGEPTLHPHFWQIIGECLGTCNEDGGLWMATNGSKTEIALKLARMARAGVLGVALSQDQWHDKIDKRVIEAFRKDNISSYSMREENRDLRDIRTVHSLKNRGRAKENELGDDESGCACEEWFISPEGNFKQCGCLNAPALCNILKVSSKKIYKIMDSFSGDIVCFNSKEEKKLEKALLAEAM